MSLVVLLTICAVYLAWGPLPIVRLDSASTRLQSQTSQLVKVFSKTPAEPVEQFLWALHSAMLAGTALDEALVQTTALLSPTVLSSTRAALAERSGVTESLKQDAHDSDLPVLINISLLYEVSQRTGAPLAQPLMRLIISLRNEQSRRRTLTQETASVKATAIVLAALPLFGCLMSLSLGLNPLSWFCHSPLGALCCLIGISLEVAGWKWIQFLMRKAMDS